MIGFKRERLQKRSVKNEKGERTKRRKDEKEKG